MNRRTFLRLLMSGTAGLALTGLRCAGQSEPPNIVLILADDLGWNEVGCYGSDFYETPNIDRLATQGMRFTAAYAACPVCSPTRASLMTGKYPARLHLTDFIKGGDPPPGSPLKHPDWQKFLPLSEITIAELLQPAGYATAAFGKWHLSIDKTPPASLPYNPDKQGFDESFVTYKPSRSLAKPWQTPENDGHNVHIITGKSLDFLDRHQQQPFFLYISHNSIHDPVMEKQALIEKYRAKLPPNGPPAQAVLGAMIETLDDSVGQVMQKLDDLDLADNTLLIFFSDNGGLDGGAKAGFPSMAPLRGGKADLYEGGIRVPLIARWPGKIPAGTTSAEPVNSIDFFPTFAAAAGHRQLPPNVDGVNLLPVLEQQRSLNRNALFWHYPHYHSAGDGPSGAVRAGKYKLIEWYEALLLDRPHPVELYDLSKDIGERHDLADAMPDRARQLQDLLHHWRERVGAQMPVPVEQTN